MTLNLLPENNLKFLSLKGGYTGSSESIHVKMPHCWKSHVMAQNFKFFMNEKQIHLPVDVSKFNETTCNIKYNKIK